MAVKETENNLSLIPFKVSRRGFLGLVTATAGAGVLSYYGRRALLEHERSSNPETTFSPEISLSAVAAKEVEPIPTGSADFLVTFSKSESKDSASDLVAHIRSISSSEEARELCSGGLSAILGPSEHEGNISTTRYLWLNYGEGRLSAYDVDETATFNPDGTLAGVDRQKDVLDSLPLEKTPQTVRLDWEYNGRSNSLDFTVDPSQGCFADRYQQQP